MTLQEYRTAIPTTYAALLKRHRATLAELAEQMGRNAHLEAELDRAVQCVSLIERSASDFWAA